MRDDLLSTTASAANREAPITPKFCTIKTWCDISGMSRATVYNRLGDGSLQGKKLGKRLLIDAEHGLAWL